MSITTTVSIVIPMYNEEERLPRTFDALREFVRRNESVRQIVMVDDGSTDATRLVAMRDSGDLPVDLVTYSDNAGKGYAIRRGVLQTISETVLITDADLSTPLDEITTLMPYLEDHEVVIGSRGLEPSTVKARQPWYRQQMGRTFNLLMRTITGLPFRDTQCGFKLMRGDVAKTVFEEAVVDRFAYDVEMLVLALRHGYSVCEIPVLWYDAAGSRVSIGRDAPRMLLDTLRIRRRLGRPRTERATMVTSPATSKHQSNQES